jgi:hypothetical protein
MGTSRMSSNINSVFKSIINQLMLIVNINNDELETSYKEEFEKRKKRKFIGQRI